MDFVIAHWTVIAPCIGLIISELMPLLPEQYVKYNGVVHAILVKTGMMKDE